MRLQSAIFRTSLLTLLIALLLCAGPEFARADLFRLASGGQVEGEWVNREENPVTQYVIRPPSGMVVKLRVEQVREHLRQTEVELEYETLAPTYADTVEDQWKLAEWCRQKRLSRQRTAHLMRIIEIAPDHQQARALLGFVFINGEWTTQQAYRRQEGYEFYRGRWRTPQEIELLETRAKQELAEKDWLVKLSRLRSHLGTDKSAAAGEAISKIKDPVAVRPLASMLARERLREVKMLYVDVLANIASGDSVALLVQTSLSDADEEMFHYCVDKIVQLQPPHIADEYIKGLRDANNSVVNRSAAALSRIGDRSAISPLIDALITTHQRVLAARISPDATAAAFAADGGTSFMQNDGPKVIVSRVQNQHVLDALSRLAGSSFGYDQKAWRLWYDQERRAEESRQAPATRRE